MSRLACAIRSSGFLLTAALLAPPGITWAQHTDARLRALETQVEALKKRVEVLEGGPASSSTAAPAPAGMECRADRLKMSMTQAEVRAVLGEPATVGATPLQTVWRYGCGSAYFDADTKLFVGFERTR